MCGHSGAYHLFYGLFKPVAYNQILYQDLKLEHFLMKYVEICN